VRLAGYLLPVRGADAAWFRLQVYLDTVARRERVVLAYGAGGDDVLVRIQRETLLDRFAPMEPRLRQRWYAAVARIVAHGRGVTLFADEGRRPPRRRRAAPARARRRSSTDPARARSGRARRHRARPRRVRGLTMADDAWRAGHAILTARLRDIPDALARTAASPLPPLAVGASPIRRVVATGVGSSAAHAALLAHELRRAGRAATTIALSAFLAPPVPAPDDVLVVFSQGLSPTARLALAEPAAWRRVVLVTAVTDDARLAPLRAAGITIVPIDGENEFGTLVRVIGPLTGAVAALRLAEALGGPAAPDLSDVGTIVRDAVAPDVDPAALDVPLALVTSGTYGEIVQNLQYKVMEGMLRPMPPVWDVLHLAHGPFQERFASPTTFLALARPDAAGEDEALDRFATMLDPSRHALVKLAARHPSPLALFEHEAMLNALMLADLARRGVDQVAWPGHGRDAPLYGLADRPAERRLGRLTWPRLDGVRLAIVPLGATEQHGPHLPFATDTLVADALATRLAARFDDAVALPALPVGVSPEHLAFPGTLAVAPASLVAVLTDVLRSLHAHGVARAFVFSAHGGNVATLRDAAPSLRAAAPGLRVDVMTDLDGLTARLHAEAAAFGVAAEAAGHHAGEIETSMLLHLHPELVVRDAMAPDT
jgi:creatinine amidohydrolase